MADPEIYVIPLQPYAQRFSTTLGGVEYTLNTYFRRPPYGDGWSMDFGRADGTAQVNGIAMVLGDDLMRPYQYVGLEGRLILMSDGDDGDTDPGFADLGVTVQLYWTPFIYE